jgi:hypothetical protein
MTLFPYFLSLILGLCVVLNIFKDAKNTLSSSFTLATSFGLGLGLSSLLTFFAVLIFQGYHPIVIFLLNLGVTVGLLLYSKQLIKIFFGKILSEIKHSTGNILLWCGVLFYGVLFFYIGFVAYLHPWGDWDAWALWNMKLKFIIYNGAAWTDIFHKLHWHTQPDYPLLLPMMNAWGLCLSPHYPQTNAPFVTSIVYTLLSVFLLYSALSLFIPRLQSFLASLICLANPYFVFKATSQYADTVFTYYLLGCLVFLYLSLLYREKSLACLLGLFLGLLTFCKNEGIAIFVLSLLIFVAWIIFNKNIKPDLKKEILLSFFVGFVITSSATIILKLFFAPPNRDILTNLNGQLSYLNLNGLLIVKKYVLDEINDKRWVHIWHVGLLLLLIGAPKLYRRDILPISVFFLSYLSILLFIYLTTTTMDLGWRLKSTIPRIFFYLMPSIVFMSFLIHFKKDPAKQTS